MSRHTSLFNSQSDNLNGTPSKSSFRGVVETTMDALRIILAARNGLIPVFHSLSKAEVTSGAVFVYSIEESGMEPSTDGLVWSVPRVVGNFLEYQEIGSDERQNSRVFQERKGAQNSKFPTPQILARVRQVLSAVSLGSSSGGKSDKQGLLNPDGLNKKTISVNVNGSTVFLVSYYTSSEIISGQLKRPTAHPDIMNIFLDSSVLHGTIFRFPPKIEQGSDGRCGFIETEEPAPYITAAAQNQPFSSVNSGVAAPNSAPESCMFYGAHNFTITNSTFNLHPNTPQIQNDGVAELLNRLDRLEHILCRFGATSTRRRSHNEVLELKR
ncbi:Gti1/Pac2 family-domain-containing protein [Favolaschia claudopus]|uniref:Gti1/Pac2 family-domain-containing protein n=1 Tax=Favolaschia claudopus TaxID=2862362 RepID=A0AAW0BFT7_9AGAR